MQATSENISVLFIEDCREHAAVIGTQFEQALATSHRIEHAASKREALEKVRAGGIDVAVVGCHLAEGRGTDLIREAVAEGVVVPFILLTCHADPSIDMAAMEAGAVDYLEKDSLTPQILERSIRYSVQRRDVETSLAKARQTEESAKKYIQAVLDSLSTYIAVLDPEGTVERLNDAWKQQDDKNLPFGAYFREGDRLFEASTVPSHVRHHAFQSCVQRVQDGKNDRASDVVRIASNGSVRWFLITVTRPQGIFNDRIVVACEDVTIARSHERKAKLLEKAFETTTEGIVITDATQPDNPIVYVNAGFERNSGYPRKELIGRNCRFLQGEQTDPNAVAEIRDAINAGGPCHVELINHRKDGTPFWNELRIAPILSVNGSVEHYVGVQSDVTARKQSEQELRESRARFDRAVRGSAEALWEWDATTGELWFSPLWFELLGYEEEDLPPHVTTFEAILHKDDRERTMAALLHHLDSREPYDVEYRLQTKSNGYRWFRARGVAEFDDDGTPKRMSGSVQDITDRKATEASLRDKESQLRHKQRMEAVGSLAGGIAHEFNNLLHVIKGYTEFAIEQYEQESTIDLDDLREAVGASNRATRLTRQLLDFSRSEEPDLTREDSNTIVTDLQSLIRPLLGEQVTFRTHLCEPTAPVLADRTLLTQALMNLCVNARDAMPDGGTLMITTECVQVDEQEAELRTNIKPGQYSRFSVTDTGCGIPVDLIGRIFDPFFTTKEAGKGTGMGLAFVYGVVQQHQGFVDVSSEPDVGTTFEIYLPLCCVDEGAEPTPRLKKHPVPENAPLILVAEDEKTVRKVATRILERNGYATIVAEDGEEAVLQFRQNADRISLVLLDVTMPKLSGRKAFEEIRRIRPDTPAVFCTGYDPHSQQLEGVLQSGIPIVEKPFAKHDLLNVVNAALKSPWNAGTGNADPFVIQANAGSTILLDEPVFSASINHQQLLERSMNNLDFAQELLADFGANLIGGIEKITHSFKIGDSEATTNAAHSLKGAAGIVGAETIQCIASSIESTGRPGGGKEMPSLLRQLNAEACRLYDELPEIRSKLAAEISV